MPRRTQDVVMAVAIGVLAILVATNPSTASFRQLEKAKDAQALEGSVGSKTAELLASVRQGVRPKVRYVDSYAIFSLAEVSSRDVFLGVGGRWFLLPDFIGQEAAQLHASPVLRGDFTPQAAAAGMSLVSVVVHGLRQIESCRYFLHDHSLAGSRIFHAGGRRFYTIFVAGFFHASVVELLSDFLSLFVVALTLAENLRLSGPNFLRLALAAVGLTNLVASIAQLVGHRRSRNAAYASGLFPVALAALAFAATRRGNTTIHWFGLQVTPGQALVGQIAVDIFLLRRQLVPHLPASAAAALTGYLFFFYMRFGLWSMLPRAYDHVV